MSDKIIDDLLKEFYLRRREINVVELMSLFPDFDDIIPQMKLEKLKLLLPDVHDQYGGDKAISVRLNPASSSNDEEAPNFLKKSNKFVFKKDAVELSIAMAFELLVENENKEWDVIRTGYMSVGGGATIKRDPKSKSTFIITKPNAGFKKFQMFDPSIEDEEEREMVNEAGAIFGLVNLMVRQKLQKEYIIDLPLELLPQFNPNEFHFSITPGFL